MDYISEFEKRRKTLTDRPITQGFQRETPPVEDVPEVPAGGVAENFLADRPVTNGLIQDRSKAEPIVPSTRRRGAFLSGMPWHPSTPTTTEEAGDTGLRASEGRRAIAEYKAEVSPEVPSSRINSLARASSLAMPDPVGAYADFQRRSEKNAIQMGIRSPDDMNPRDMFLWKQVPNGSVAPQYRDAAGRELADRQNQRERASEIVLSEARQRNDLAIARAKAGTGERFITTDKPVFDPETGQWIEPPSPKIQGWGNRVFMKGDNGEMREVHEDKPLVVDTPAGGVTELLTVDPQTGQYVPIRQIRNPAAERTSTYTGPGFKTGETSRQGIPIITDFLGNTRQGVNQNSVESIPEQPIPAGSDTERRRRWRPGDPI